MKDQDLPDTVSEFIDQKGAVEILFEIGSGAKRYNEIAEATTISSATLTRRLKGGVHLNLWEAKEFDQISYSGTTGVDPTENRYVTDERGKEVMEQMQEIGLPRAIVKYRTWKDEVRELTGELKDRVEEEDI